MKKMFIILTVSIISTSLFAFNRSGLEERAKRIAKNEQTSSSAILEGQCDLLNGLVVAKVKIEFEAEYIVNSSCLVSTYEEQVRLKKKYRRDAKVADADRLVDIGNKICTRKSHSFYSRLRSLVIMLRTNKKLEQSIILMKSKLKTILPVYTGPPVCR